MKLCVLVTTMHQNDFSKYYTMNLHSDVVIANQCDRDEIVETTIDGHAVKMVSTKGRGVSLNRNIAIEHCYDAEYVMFADDDLVFSGDYVDTIKLEFENHPGAEAIKFNLNFICDSSRICMSPIQKWERATRKNMSSSGVCGIVINKSILKRGNLFFDEMFGPGTSNYCGEDTIFVQDMINKKIKFYRSEKYIGKVVLNTSSWYEGQTERYYETAGMVFQRIYPNIAWILALRSSIKHSRRDSSGFSFGHMLKCYLKGIRKIKRGDY